MGIFDRIAGTLDELTRDAGGPADAKEEIELAWAFAERGDLATAEERLRDVTARFPKLGPAFARLGAVLARRGSVDEAIVAYGHAVDLDGDHPADWFALGELLSRAGRFEPARDAFRRTLALSVDTPERGHAHAALGRLYAAHGHLGKATRELQKALEIAPGDQALCADYGRVLARLGDRQGADWLTRAAREPGADPALFIEAADAGDNPSVAESLLREGLLRAPGNARLRAALARYLSRRGQTEEALALAVESLAAAPADPGALAALREAYAAAHRWPEALQAALRQAELGAPPPLRDLVALALAARDRQVLRQSLLRASPDDPAGSALLAALRAFLDGAATEAELMTLAAVAPHEETQATRRYVIEALAPPPIPADNLFALLGYAHQLASRTPELQPLMVGAAHALDAFDRPLLVAVMGEFNAGKSSFVNALLGEAIAPVGVTPTTATINVLRHGPVGGRILYHDGTARDLGAHSVGPFLREVSDQEAGSIRVVEIFHPLEILQRVEVVDTPGLNSLRAEHEKAARDFLLDADAIVWLFAVGQAAKATEQQALRLAHGAGKRVVGVLNKVDRADPAEIAEVSAHVTATVGELLDVIVPLSARRALEARQKKDEAGQKASGLKDLEEVLEARFFRNARALKRTTAVAALRRFIGDARAAVAAAPLPVRDFEGERGALASCETRVRGALAVERVALRARIDETYRNAAFEVREFVRPRTWLFGEHRAEQADEEFLIDLLDEAIARAATATRAALLAALLPDTEVASVATSALASVRPAVTHAVDVALDRFRAYARGVIEGGAVAEFFRHDLPRIRLDLAAIRNALARRAPDPEAALFGKLAGELTRLYRVARVELDAAETNAAIAAIMREERLTRPLELLAQAVDHLASQHEHADHPPVTGTPGAGAPDAGDR